MSDPVSKGPGRSNLWGAITTLILEWAVVATLAVVGLGISLLMLWLTG
ncbi:MAG: hypothetical protein OEM81_01540 [Acidimicrobiia bacterium]|nr:hypothetical protein [Acidimicrobiia bacterium]MDH3396494.1 hypothetical protein [Acidimicrobiia bacterium]MDH5615020.1 hypothetical protein [Acidimicrobiia bacterium]